MLDNKKENILLLGMVFSEQLLPERGQEFRDRVRCIELQRLGFNVCTVDDKHNDDYLFPGLHCNANFNNDRGFVRQVRNKWGRDVQFKHIILDYFFCPVGWARTRWSPKFYSDTIPAIASNLLSPGGKLWLPNLENVRDSIELNRILIESVFIIQQITNPLLNPLYAATENCTQELLRCPDSRINENQIAPLICNSQFPFYALESLTKSLSLVHDLDQDSAGATETLFMWDTIIMAPCISDGVVLVRVFTGGKASIQSGPFSSAIRRIQRECRGTSKVPYVEYMDTQMLAESKWQPHQFVEWFLHSHVHVIIAHSHQSLFNHNLMWNMSEALAQFQRLRYHAGFPTGNQLRCPVFTQDKIDYIRCLGELAVTTITIPVTECGNYPKDCLAKVKQ